MTTDDYFILALFTAAPFGPLIAIGFQCLFV